MGREIDERKKRKALRKLRKAAELAERGEGPPLSDWEREFLEEVEERIETYGSAFADPEKGSLEDPMSALQSQKLREIDKKARGKGGGFKTRKPLGAKKKPAYSPRVRQIDDDTEDDNPPEPPEPRPKRPALGVIRGSELPDRGDTARKAASEKASEDPPAKRPAFRVIRGGKDDA
ncbi:hypothetical protein [Henriciella aquimarina]|uniref:hypothetical protein n=1 Tax=Henriciella aquimarina TaxID=545261 RepID=UPI0009FE4FA1|nr:hypothetical protein [Henriciella aquimarina]